MGTWGSGCFDNDDAMDWASDLEDTDSDELIVEAFDAVLDGEEYLEAPEAAAGIAAADVVAALDGKPSGKLPDQVSTWLAGQKPPDRILIERARQVVERVRDESELQELFDESDYAAEWYQEIEGLLQRLSG